MNLPVEILIAILLGTVLLIALLRGFYLTGRSLGWGEESIDNLPEKTDLEDQPVDTTEAEPTRSKSPDEPRDQSPPSS